jgi:hypothetical protein
MKFLMEQVYLALFFIIIGENILINAVLLVSTSILKCGIHESIYICGGRTMIKIICALEKKKLSLKLDLSFENLEK